MIGRGVGEMPKFSMKTVEVYDPALCCSSGVCGPSPDEALIAFAGVLELVKKEGVEVKRFNLAQEPMAFANKPEVKAVLEKDGEDGLPLLFLDGELYFRGAYPSGDQLRKVLGLKVAEPCCSDDSECGSGEKESASTSFVKVSAAQAAGSSCCDPSSGCC